MDKFRNVLIIFSVLFLFIIITDIFSEEVDIKELEMNMEEVDFINYMGPHEFINTRQEIISIGHNLASGIISGSFQSGIAGRYRILHLVDKTEKGKLGAVVFIIEPDARVDHIRNIRLILSGYLEQVYSYSSADAYLIAEFATYYNAVHRGNLDFFSQRYINMVLTNISRENAGIDVHDTNWPGKTRLLVPLTAASGEMEKPDPFELAGDAVVEDLRKTEDMGLEPRKQIIELQEKSVEEEKVRLAEKEKEAEELEKALLAEKEALAEDSADPEGDERKETEKAVAEKEKELEEKKSVIAEQKEDLEKKEERIASEREKIADDTNLVLEKEASIEEKRADSALTEGIREPDKTVFLKMEKRESIYTGRFGLYVTESGEQTAESPVATTGGRLYLETDKGFIIPAENGRESFYLNLIGSEKLETLLKTEQEVYAETFILGSGNNIYCVIKQDGKWKLARYSQDLKLLGVSAADAYPHTYIRRAESRVLFQNAAGEVVSVDYQTLE